jgi:hypothetical protein
LKKLSGDLGNNENNFNGFIQIKKDKFNEKSGFKK